MKGSFGLCTLMVGGLLLSGCAAQNSQAEYIGIDAAKAVAIAASGVPASSASFTTAGLDRRDGLDFYAVDFTAGGEQYEYDIDAVTGIIIDSRTPSPPDDTPAVPSAAGEPTGAPGNSSLTEDIGESKAKEIALADAGYMEEQVTFVKSRLEWEDGRQVYDVEFYTAAYKEYDYEIDAVTGEIVSMDYEAEDYTPPTAGSGNITAEDAKALALAKVPGATVDDIYEFEADYDDGRLEYEGKILYSGMEYEFEIDGYSGSIRSWETERIHH